MSEEANTSSDDTRAFLAEDFFAYLRRRADSAAAARAVLRESPGAIPAPAGQPEQLRFEFSGGSGEHR
jgi:hypothetical protein